VIRRSDKEQVVVDELVQRLSEGDHRLVASRYKTAEELKQALDRGYVLVKFADTQGGTELGVRLDSAATDLTAYLPQTALPCRARP
jgi:ribosomal protein S24E